MSKRAAPNNLRESQIQTLKAVADRGEAGIRAAELGGKLNITSRSALRRLERLECGTGFQTVERVRCNRLGFEPFIAFRITEEGIARLKESADVATELNIGEAAQP